MVLNLLTGSISTQYHVVSDDTISTVMRRIATDPEVCITIATSRNPTIHVMFDQEYDPDLDGELLTDNERLKRLRKVRESIVGRVKGAELPYLKDLNLLRKTYF